MQEFAIFGVVSKKIRKKYFASIRNNKSGVSKGNTNLKTFVRKGPVQVGFFLCALEMSFELFLNQFPALDATKVKCSV